MALLFRDVLLASAGTPGHGDRAEPVPAARCVRGMNSLSCVTVGIRQTPRHLKTLVASKLCYRPRLSSRDGGSLDVRRHIIASYRPRFSRRPVGPATGLLLPTVAVARGGRSALARNATHNVRHVTCETAIKVLSTALETCRTQGYQAAVAGVDRRCAGRSRRLYFGSDRRLRGPGRVGL